MFGISCNKGTKLESYRAIGLYCAFCTWLKLRRRRIARGRYGCLMEIDATGAFLKLLCFLALNT